METFVNCKEDLNYAVSTEGNVKSNRTGKLLKQENTNRTKEDLSYKRVSFSYEGTVTRHLVHRLVASNFITNDANKPYVNHIDNNPSNNCVNNLEWVTHSENMLHCNAQGRGTYSSAAKQAVLNKLSAKEEDLRLKLGNNFVSINKAERSTVTFLCQKCNTEHTCRLDSATLKLPTVLCKKCGYASRHLK